MPKTNLELPSVDEIDFELKELPKQREAKADVKSLQKEVQDTQQIFDKLKQNLDILKEQEFQIELKKAAQKEKEFKLKEYEKRFHENIEIIETLKQSLLGLNNEFEKNKKKLEYYKELSVQVSNKLDSQNNNLMSYDKKLSITEQSAKENEQAGILLENKIVEMEGIIKDLKQKSQQNEEVLFKLREMIKKLDKEKFFENKKHQFYKQKFLDLINSKHINIESMDSLKRKNMDLEELNKKLEYDGNLFEDKLKEVSDTLIKTQHELESKEKLFQEQNEKIKEIKKKSIENLTIFHALKEKSDKLEKLNKELLERNSLLEEKTREHLALLKKLKEQLEFKDSDSQEETDKIKKEYEKKLKNLIEKNTTIEIGLRAHINFLNQEIEALKGIIKEKEAKEKEILSNINLKFGSLIGENKEK